MAGCLSFHFYDRLQQGLQRLSALVEAPNKLYGSAELQKLRQETRGGWTSEAEKILFDAIHMGKSIEEAMVLVAESEKSANHSELEFF